MVAGRRRGAPQLRRTCPTVTVLWAITAIMWLAPRPASAQVKAANITGFVQDQLERRVLGATVSATSTRTGVRYQAKTDENGSFDFIGVRSGDYVLHARFSGFSAFADVVTMGGADIQRTITLELAPVPLTFTVSKDVGQSAPVLITATFQATSPEPAKR